VVAEVPFVDCVTTMLDPGIPLTIGEWDEWGDPRDPDIRAYMESYSPYDNVPPGPRPGLLVTGSLHDPRVLIHEPAKWVARLRATDTSGSRLLSARNWAPGRTSARRDATTGCATRPGSSPSSWPRWHEDVTASRPCAFLLFARPFYCPDMRILGTRGSSIPVPGASHFDRGLPSALRHRSPSMTIAANDRQTF
jgi:hypothetical protein